MRAQAVVIIFGHSVMFQYAPCFARDEPELPVCRHAASSREEDANYFSKRMQQASVCMCVCGERKASVYLHSSFPSLPHTQTHPNTSFF